MTIPKRLMGTRLVVSISTMDRARTDAPLPARANVPLPEGTNLEVAGQNSRLRLGVAMLGIALAITVVLVQADVHRGWRAILFIPFFLAASGAWQGLFRTCPVMAMKGVRESSGGETPVCWGRDASAAKSAGWMVIGGALATALFSTAVVMLLP